MAAPPASPSSEGAFADLDFDDRRQQADLHRRPRPGIVRVAIPTKDMAGDVGKDRPTMPQTRR